MAETPIKAPTSKPSTPGPSAKNSPAGEYAAESTLARGAAEPAKKPISPVAEINPEWADWFPESELVFGTQQNSVMLSNLKADKRYQAEHQRLELAFQYQSRYEEASKRYLEEVRKAHIANERTGIGFIPNLNPPKSNPYAQWVSGFGANADEAATNIASTQSRVDHVYKRLIETGFLDRLDSDSQLATDFEDLRFNDAGKTMIGEWMRANGFLKTDQEVDLFNRHSVNKYSSYWGISLHDRLDRAWRAKNPNREFRAQDLAIQILRGRSFDPGNPQDVADWERFKAWRVSQPGQKWLNNFFIGMGHMLESFGLSLKESARAMLYPEFDWSDDWKIAKGENAELKRKFIDAFDVWKKDPRSTGDWELSAYADSQKSGGDILDMEFPDPATPKEVNERTQELLSLYRQLKSKGAFKTDKWGFAAGLAAMDGVVQGTLAISSLAFSTDPSSPVFWAGKQFNKNLILLNELQNGKGLSDIQKAYISRFYSKEHDTRAEMAYFKASVHGQNFFMEASQNGLMFTGDWYDSKVGFNTSMWADVFLVAAPVSKGLSLMRGAAAQRAILGGTAVARGSIEATIANVNYITRRGVKFPEQIQKFIDIAASELGKRTGREIKTAEAVEALLKGEDVLVDATNNTKRALTDAEKQMLRNKIVDHANSVFQVRRELAAVHLQGREWYANLSQKSKDTMAKLRQRLQEIEPDGGWDKVDDFDIYKRLRMSSSTLEKEGVQSAVKLSKEELISLQREVGNHWRGVEVTGKSGFRSADSLGMRPWDPAFYASLGGQGVSQLAAWLAKGFGWAADKAVAWISNHIVSPSDIQTGLRATTTPTHEISSTRIGVGNQTALERVGQLNRFIAAGKLVGDWEGAFLAYRDYFEAMRKAPVDATTVSHGLKVGYQKRLDEINEIIERNEMAGTKLTTAQRTALENERAQVVNKLQTMSRVDASTRYGFLDAVSGVGSYGGSLIVGEGLLFMNDTDSQGLASGFVSAMRGGHIVGHSIVKHVHPTMTLKERANLNLYSLSQRISNLPPAQGAILIEAIARLAERRDATYKEKGVGVLRLSPEKKADIEFAQGMAFLDRLYSINGDVILTKGTGVIDAAATIATNGDLRGNPELREMLINRLIEESGKLGLTGTEARDYAVQLLQNHEDSVVAANRVGNVDTEIAQLEGQKQDIAKKVSKRLEAVKATLKVYLAEAGVNPDRVFVGPAWETFGMGEGPMGSNIKVDYEAKTGKIIIDGKEVAIPGIEGVNQKIVEKIEAAISEWKAINSDIQVLNGEVVKINDQIRVLNDEKAKLVAVPQTPGFNNKPVVMTDDGSIVYNRKGLTIWDQVSRNAEGQEITRAKVFLDIETLLERAKYVEEVDPVSGKPSKRMVDAGGYAILLEEYSHALFFSEAMRDVRVQMEADILGGWMIDEEGVLVNKTVGSDGRLVDAPPRITGDAEKNLELIRKYAEAYAEGLPSDMARAEFLTRFDYGVKRWRENKMDTRHLQGVFIEMYGSMYTQRMLGQTPSAGKDPFGSGQSFFGAWNTAPIFAGETTMQRWLKFVFGQTELADIMMENRYDLTSIDPASPEAAMAEAALNSSLNVVRYFMPGGHLELFTKNNIKQRLTHLGVLKNNNDSNDPFAAWSQSEMFSGGRWREIPLEARSWIDGGIRHTRNLGSPIIWDDPHNIQRLQSKQNSLDPEEIKFRVTWAYATGRRHWLSSRNDPIRVGTAAERRQAGVFKERIEDLFFKENKVVRDFVGMVLRDDPDGTNYGLTLKKTGQNYTLVGMPNPEQAYRVLEWIKEQNRIRTEEDNLFMMNDQTMAIIKEMLGSLSNASFHKDASNSGYNRVYRGEYFPNRTGLGAGTTATVKATEPRNYTFSPVMLIIKDTQLTAEGKKIYKGTNREGETAFLSKPMLYILAMHHEARENRIVASWQGRLSDKTGKRYPWNSDEMVRLFGDFNTFASKVQDVFVNYATGKYGITAGDLPENRTWELLHDFAGGDKKKAIKMAAIIHRTIGTWDNEYVEVARAERDMVRTRSERKRAELEEFVETTKDDPNYSPDDRQKFLMSLIDNDTREIGAGPMSDTRAPFMLIRPDRFVGMPMQMMYGRGTKTTSGGAVFPINGASYGYAQVAYGSQGPWARMPMDELKTLRASLEWGGSVLRDAWTHPAGYTVWSVSHRKGGKFQKPTYNLIAPDGSVVKKPVGTKTITQFDTVESAFEYAGFHSRKNPQDNKPILGNETEMAMQAAGWNPRGTKFAVNARSEFASADNRFFIRRNDRGAWDLYHNDSGIMLMPDIPIYGMEVDAKGRKIINPKELPAIIQHAEDLRLIETAMDIDFISKYVPSFVKPGEEVSASVQKQLAAFMEWKVSKGQRAGLAHTKRQFSDNHYYWEWKRALARATSPIFAIEASNRLVNELGADVVAADTTGVKTQEWVRNFDKRLQEEGLFAAWLDKRSFDQIKADEHAEAARDRAEQFRKDIKEGDTEAKKPVAPAKPIREAYDTVEGFNAAIADWDNATKRYHQDLLDYESWHRGMSEREMALNWEKLRQQHIAHYRALIEKDSATVRSWWVPELGGVDIEGVANAKAMETLNRTLNAARESGEAVARDAWLSQSGYLIQQMMYNEPKFGPGVKIEIGSGKKRNEPGKPAISFWVFSAQGNLVGKYETWEDARRASFLDKYGKGIGNLVDLSKEPKKTEVKSVEPTNRQKVLQAIDRYAK